MDEIDNYSQVIYDGPITFEEGTVYSFDVFATKQFYQKLNKWLLENNVAFYIKQCPVGVDENCKFGDKDFWEKYSTAMLWLFFYDEETAAYFRLTWEEFQNNIN